VWAFLHACSIANAESKKLAQSRAGNAHLRCRFLLVVLLPSSILDVHVIQIHLPSTLKYTEARETDCAGCTNERRRLLDEVAQISHTSARVLARLRSPAPAKKRFGSSATDSLRSGSHAAETARIRYLDGAIAWSNAYEMSRP
jgi:hypothetical protein